MAIHFRPSISPSHIYLLCLFLFRSFFFPSFFSPSISKFSGKFDLADKTFSRQDLSPTDIYIADRTFCRQDIRPTGQFTDISIIWNNVLIEITFIVTFTHIYKLCAIALLYSLKSCRRLSPNHSQSLWVLNSAFQVNFLRWTDGESSRDLLQ